MKKTGTLVLELSPQKQSMDDPEDTLRSKRNHKQLLKANKSVKAINNEQLSILIKDICEQYHIKQTYHRRIRQWPVLLQEEYLQAWWVGMLPGLRKHYIRNWLQ